MLTPLYKSFKKNGTSMYVFPSVAEDKNYEHANENYNMYVSHYVLVNFPRQSSTVLNFEDTFEGGSIDGTTFAEQMVESLRNYVANHEAVIRNMRQDATTYFYDVNELHTVTERVFWKWCKKLKLIDFDKALSTEYMENDPKYLANTQSTDNTYFQEYLWKERGIYTYNVLSYSQILPTSYNIILDEVTTLKVGDSIILNESNVDGLNLSYSVLEITAVSTTSYTNDTISVTVVNPITTIASELEIYLNYNSFIKFIGEIAGTNNTQLPDKAYTETYAYISHQHGQIPYSLWKIVDDNNYKPNAQYPVLPEQYTPYIQGAENSNNPLWVNPTAYPGGPNIQTDIINQYITSNGNVSKKSGPFYGIANNDRTSPEFDSSQLDGLCLNLDIEDYLKAQSYIYPIETFNEFCATSFDNIAPKDFEFNAILWYYTLEDTSGNNLNKATNLYGIEFLDTSSNDINNLKTKIPSIQKLVSNGYQDGNSYTFSLDTNLIIDSDVVIPSFDPDKVYSLFGMELFHEALTRITYFNDQISTFVNSNMELTNKVNNLTSLVMNQTSFDSIKTKMNNLEKLLTLYSTLQIGNSDTIIAKLDTSVTPAVVRLNSIDKRYSGVNNLYTGDLWESTLNLNGFQTIVPVEKTINVVNGKDFKVNITNNVKKDSLNSPVADNIDTTIKQEHLSVVIEKDLDLGQTLDITINCDNEAKSDKKLDLYLNYTSSINGTEKLLLKTFSLPVYKTNSLTSSIDEAWVNLQNLPEYKIENVIYNKSSINERQLTFNISNLNNNFLKAGQRINIENLLLSTDLINNDNYFNFDNQFEILTDTVASIEVTNIDIINQGSDYTDGNVGILGAGDFKITTDSNKIVKVEPVLSTLSTILSTTSPTAYDKIGTTYHTIPGNPLGSGAVIALTIKYVTQVTVKFNFDTLSDELKLYFTSFDTKYSDFGNSKIILNNYMYNTPIMSFIKGYNISICRIYNELTESTNDLNKKYDIKINKL